MKQSIILSLPELPFSIGVFDRPANPAPLPSTHPAELCLNEELGRLELSNTPGLEALLTSAYSLGIELGTPSDDTDLGRPYVMDFAAFIGEVTDRRGRALEIGAGVGYLSRVLSDAGWDVDSIEPGKGYERQWERHGLKVVNDFFPSPSLKGPYDLIVFYTVLEHIKDTRVFLRTVADHLAPGGQIVLSVPDCTLEIEAGDPSMLMHEHYQYFTRESLSRTLVDAGYDPIVRGSGFGRSLYACAKQGAGAFSPAVAEKDLAPFRDFAEKVNRHRSAFREKLARHLSRGSVGVYCPGRALALLPKRNGARFFDDSPSLQGKCYPPFSARIESRDELLKDPPDTLFIMSRTFGPKLSAELAPLLPGTLILGIEEALHDG